MRTLRTGTMRPRNSSVVGYTTMIFPFQPAQLSPNAPRSVLLLVLFNTSPRGSLVNQTHQFLLLVLSYADFFLGHRLDAQLLFSR